MEVKVALGESVLMQISSGRQRQCSVAGGMHTRRAGSSLKMIGNLIVGNNLPLLVGIGLMQLPNVVPMSLYAPAYLQTMRAMQLERAEGWHAYLSRARMRHPGLPALTGTVKNNPVSYHYSSATPMHFQFEQMQFQLQL